MDLYWEPSGAPAEQRYIVQINDDAEATWWTGAFGIPKLAVSRAHDDLTRKEVLVRILATTGLGDTALMRTGRVHLRLAKSA